MKILLLPLLILALTTSLTVADKLPGIEYLSFGYDIYYGNPHTIGNDPGFRMLPIYEFIYEDPLFGISHEEPYQVAITMMDASKLTEVAHWIYSTNKYQKSLREVVSVEGIFPPAAFKNSFDYRWIDSVISTANRTVEYVYAEGSRSLYSAEIDKNSSPGLSSDFKHYLKTKLPTSYDEAAYMQFLQVYGTHAVKKIEVGIRFAKQFNLPADYAQNLLSRNISLESAAQKTLTIMSGAEIPEWSNEDKKLIDEFKKNMYIAIDLSVTLPPLGMGAIKYELSPIYSVIDRANLDESFTDSQVKTLRANLQRAFNGYCAYLVSLGYIEDCNAPTEVTEPKLTPTQTPKHRFLRFNLV